MTNAIPLLRTTLYANAVFSAASGTALVLASSPLSGWFPVPATILAGLGGGLLLFGGAVAILARQRHPHRGAALAVSAADGAWVAGSAGLLVVDPGGLTFAGRWTVAAVAIVVLTFGLVQALCIRTPSSDGAPSLGRRIVRSWLSLKTWVKAWLFLLNGVFLVSFFFLDTPVGRWTSLAYLAAGPLLAAMMVLQRGLTRLLGLAHLVPWTPLVAYLLLRLATDRLGPRITFAGDPALYGWSVLLLAAVTACLALDLYDVIRWMRGERFVMGTEEARRAGASERTLA